jgi:hypothetical protein
MYNKSEDLIDILKRFNRKERFFLVGAALGNKTFSLGKEFKNALEGMIRIQIGGDVFVAMDYHLDWIDVSIKLWNGDITIGNKFQNKDGQINKNQEDIDLIIAFKSGRKYHLVLIEAKAETGWTNKQMDSKVKRFTEIFGKDGRKRDNLELYFYLMSPRKPKRINRGWPEWMMTDGKPNWTELKIPDNFLKVTRCDSKGDSNKLGNHCIIKETKTK